MKATNKTMDKAKAKANMLTADKTYENRLFQIVKSPVPEKILKAGNRNKSWRKGWDPVYDFVNISHDGTIGEFYLIQGLLLAVPSVPDEVYSRSDNPEEQYWEVEPSPNDSVMKKMKDTKQLSRLKPESRVAWEDFIVQEWDRRDEGFWFMNEGKPTYVTGSHYFFIRWAQIDIGHPDFRQANMIYWYFWEACKLDQRALGMCYLKNRRSGFSYMAMSETVNLSSKPPFSSQYGMLSKTGADAQSMFAVKCVKIANNLPFFFTPIRSGESNPKSEIVFNRPSRKITRKTLGEEVDLEEIETDGLDNKINWKTTNNNSYDGEKLKLLVHDESGKWVKPNNIGNNWSVVKTCLITGSKVIGKCMMGSTSNKLKEGGTEFKEMFDSSNLAKTKRNDSGETPSGLYSLFIPMEWNVEGKIDIFGKPVFTTPEKPRLEPDGETWIVQGAIEWWNNKVKGLKDYPVKQNEHIRQFPRTQNHAFRDDLKGSLFNIAKIHSQIDYNDEMRTEKTHIQTGNFEWDNGISDSKVVWRARDDGRFKISWFPRPDMQNRFVEKNGRSPYYTDLGAFGCDPYDIDVVNHGFGSNGALHGITAVNVEEAPNMSFFLEYVARPQTATIFFEEVLMACVFYGMPILIENNKPGILRYFRNRGYTNYCMLRPDKRSHELKPSDLSLRGIPNNSEDVKQMHAQMIQAYIEEYIGEDADGNIGNMPFNRTLHDWMHFDMQNRTDYDASISSGLAIMAIRKHQISPPRKVPNRTLSVPFGRFNNNGSISKLK